MEKKIITNEDIEKFIEGKDNTERIVNLKYSYNDNFITVFYRNEKGKKCVTTKPFYPFVWATRYACTRLCNGDREEVKRLLQKYKIGVKKLRNTDENGEVRHEFDDGYLFQFYAKVPMSYKDFLSFFRIAGNPVYGKKDKDGNEIQRSKAESKQFLAVPPQEQYMIANGTRFFKGYDDYDQILRMTFDIETTGLDPHKCHITHIGIKTNKGFEKLLEVKGNTPEEEAESELEAITNMLRIIFTYSPDVITAHNGENFDWYFIITRCLELGHPMEELSPRFFGGEVIRKDERETTLKLGGEIEKFHATIVPNTTVTDSLHAVRRAQATDSNFLKADLKYSTDYLGMKKENRVYIKGDIISKTWYDTENDYAFNDKDGKWYIITPEKPLQDGYEIVTGKYIVERYLLDDLWECDRVEHRLNTTNFLICKMLPIPYKKCTTMGTAGQWKGLLMGWSYENNLAIPMFKDSKTFTGGLSRLLRTGYVDRVIKLDYNSLYPSIILTWGIHDTNDLMGVMLKFLEYVLTTREKFKGLKKVADKLIEKLEPFVVDGSALAEQIAEYKKARGDFEFNDKKQSQMKVFGNSFFGSYGAPNVFPWGSIKCAEQVTCIGRQCLRLMISHFTKLGYTPIVGDSVAYDTPLFIRYKKSGYIDIKPICEIMDENSISKDALGREYDYSEKPYQVLCRSGWVDVQYVYRHKTNKDIYRVTNEEGSYVDVTKDHSLFDSDKKEIKPTEINDGTVLETYDGEIQGKKYDTEMLSCLGYPYEKYETSAKLLASGEIDRVPTKVLNSKPRGMEVFYNTFILNYNENIKYSKTALAGLKYLKNKIAL